MTAPCPTSSVVPLLSHAILENRQPLYHAAEYAADNSYSGTEGREFESLTARQPIVPLPHLL